MNSKIDEPVSGWSISALGDFLTLSLKPIPKPSQAYKSLGIRSHGKGTFQKVIKDPSKIQMDTLYKVSRNDLIVNITFAWEGAIALVKATDEDHLVSHRFPTYKFNLEKALPDFLKYIINLKSFFEQLGYISPGGAGRNRVLNKRDFIKLKVNLPPLHEQKKIAEILTCVDETIESTRKVIEQTKKVKQGLLQELLTKGIGHTKFKKTKIGEIPEEWEIVELDKVLGETKYGTSSKCDFIKTDYPVLRIPNVVTGSISDKNLKYASLPSKEANRYKLQEGDLLIVRTNGNPDYVGRCALVSRKEVGWLYASYLIKLGVIGEVISSKYLRFLLEGQSVKNAIKKEVKTSAGNYNLNIPSIKGIRIPLPSRNEQNEIVCILNSIDAETESSEKELSQLQYLKKGLMQDLLTGTVRVKV